MFAVGIAGPGIFDDDAACDVRYVWREALMDGLDSEAATARVFEQLGDMFDDEDDDYVVAWLALAAAQSQTGRLQPEVRDRALELIDAGGDLELWREEPTFSKQREKVLAKLAEKLRGPQPPPKTLKRPKFRPSPLDVGDVVHVRNDDVEALFVVVGLMQWRDPPGTIPVLAEFLWEGGPIPDVEALQTMPLVHDDPDTPDFIRAATGARYEGPVPHLWWVTCPARGKHAFKHSGEVVATGVLRPDAGDHTRDQSRGFGDGPSMSGGDWDSIAYFTTGSWHARMVETTKQVYGL
jgi:hypothetical protein